eukprot:scaffold201144_cov17-Tisochrysis_lutea.AAC.1
MSNSLDTTDVFMAPHNPQQTTITNHANTQDTVTAFTVGTGRFQLAFRMFNFLRGYSKQISHTTKEHEWNGCNLTKGKRQGGIAKGSAKRTAPLTAAALASASRATVTSKLLELAPCALSGPALLMGATSLGGVFRPRGWAGGGGDSAWVVGGAGAAGLGG